MIQLSNLGSTTYSKNMIQRWFQYASTLKKYDSTRDIRAIFSNLQGPEPSKPSPHPLGQRCSGAQAETDTHR